MPATPGENHFSVTDFGRGRGSPDTRGTLPIRRVGALEYSPGAPPVTSRGRACHSVRFRHRGR
jgi:hypothetical protein